MSKIKTALRLTKSDGGAGGWGVRQTTVGAVEHTFTCYFKVLSYSSGAQIKLLKGGNTTIALTSGHINKWARISLTYNDADTNLYLFILDADADILFTGFQTEAKANATPFHTLDSYNLSGDQIARSTQYLKIPTAGNFPGMDEGTILISFRSDWASTTGLNPYLWNMLTSAGTDEWYLRYLQASDKFTFYMTDGTGTTILSDAQSFAVGDKFLLICTWNGSVGELYVNGVAAPAQTKTQRSITLRESYIIGADQIAFADNLNGVIDEFAIFDQAITQRMVDHIYNNLFSRGKTMLGAGFLN